MPTMDIRLEPCNNSEPYTRGSKSVIVDGLRWGTLERASARWGKAFSLCKLDGGEVLPPIVLRVQHKLTPVQTDRFLTGQLAKLVTDKLFPSPDEQEAALEKREAAARRAAARAEAQQRKRYARTACRLVDSVLMADSTEAYAMEDRVSIKRVLLEALLVEAFQAGRNWK